MRFFLAGLLAMAMTIAPLSAWAATPDAEVDLVYTSQSGGIFGGGSSINEIMPLFLPELRGDVRGEGLSLDLGVLWCGRWRLWSPGTHLTPKMVTDLFKGGGVVVGAGTRVPAMTSDYAILFQPAGETPWLIDWLADKLRQLKVMPDVAMGTATVFSAKSSSGAPLLLFSEDGSRPAAEKLRHLEAWQMGMLLHMQVKRGRKASTLYAFGRRYGGVYYHGLAQALKQRHQAIRVDAGNLIESPNDPTTEICLPVSLGALHKMGFDAVVPGKNELSLRGSQLKELADSLPLVACNLTAPPGITLRPYTICERQGIRLAIVGLADNEALRRYGYLGARTGWSGEDPLKALQRALKELEPEHVQAVIVVTNLREDRLVGVRNEAYGVSAFITSPDRRSGGHLRQRYDFESPERLRAPTSRITAAAVDPQVGLLRLGFRAVAPQAEPGYVSIAPEARPVLTWAENEVQMATDGLPDPEPSLTFQMLNRVADYVTSHNDSVLPDIRLVAARDKRLVSEDGEAISQMLGPQWSMLAASALRRAADAEIAIIHPFKTASTIIGEIPRFMAEEWIPRTEELAIVTLTGAQVRKLVAMDVDRDQLSWAGYDPHQGLVGGRALNDAELYRVVTTLSLAGNETYGAAFQEEPRTALRLVGCRLHEGQPSDAVSMREVVLAQVDDMRVRHGGFDAAYLDELASHLEDDGTAYEPRLSLKIKPLQGSFQQLSVRNREPFGEVRNASVNTPDNTSYGGKGDLALTYETADLDWENRLQVGFQRLEIDTQGQHLVQEQNDNVQLGSEFRLKFIKLQLQRAALDLIPFVSSDYQSEFTPTVDPQTGKENPRRQELSGLAGVVLYPGNWLKELRLGAIAKDDLAIAGGKFEPGIQLAGAIERPLGPFALEVAADLKNYFLTPQDTPADLGMLLQLGGGLNFPLWGGLSVRIGIDALLFNGKVAATRSLGSSITPSVGLSYHTTWKPLVGVAY